MCQYRLVFHLTVFLSIFTAYAIVHDPHKSLLVQNLDECVVGSHQCNTATSTCVNNKGDTPGYYCKCETGYEKVKKDDFHCQDINECDSNLCDMRVGTCNNTPGGYICSCPTGWVLSEPVNLGTYSCLNINECYKSHGKLLTQYFPFKMKSSFCGFHS